MSLVAPEIAFDTANSGEFRDEKSFEKSCPRKTAAGINGAEFEKWFRPMFARYLTENFPSSEHAAVQFSVSARTIDNWKAQISAPKCSATGLFFMRQPDAVAWFLSRE